MSIFAHVLRPTGYIMPAFRDAMTWTVLAFLATVSLVRPSAYSAATFSILIGIGIFTFLVIEDIKPAGTTTEIPLHLRPLWRTVNRARVVSLMLFWIWSCNWFLMTIPLGFELDWFTLRIVSIVIEAFVIAMLVRASRRATRRPAITVSH